MQRFPLFILWSLVGISFLQFVFCLSQDLEPRLESTLFDELSPENTTPTDQMIISDSNGFQNVDFLNSAGESDLDWLSENVDSSNADSNNLFSNIPYSDEPDSSSLFAQHNSACDVGSADDTQLFSKKRREASTCKSPFTGQAENQNGRDQGDDSNQSGESNQENLPQIFAPLSIFSEEFDLCPRAIFKDSNIPVCRSFLEGTYELIPGEFYFTLYDVKTRRCYSYPASAIFKQRLTKCPTVAPFILPKGCLDRPITKLWCCRDLVFTVSKKSYSI